MTPRRIKRKWLVFSLVLVLVGLAAPASLRAQKLESVEVEGQPLAANATRLAQALEFLGMPFSKDTAKALEDATQARDANNLQQLLDPHVLVVVSINPEARVKAARGPASATLQQGGYVPVIVKVINDSTVKKALRITSPQAGPVYSGGGAGNAPGDKNRFLQVEMYTSATMTANLSGLKAEYALALIYSSEAGK